MTRGVALAVVVGLFVIGVASGILGASIYMRTQAPPGESPPEHVAPPRAMERLGRDLQLTPEQQREIRRILGESHREGQALREEMRPRIEALMEDTREQVRAVLDDEQRAKLESMREGERRRFERLLLGNPPERRMRRPGDRRRPSR